MRRLLPLIWAGIIAYLSLIPANELPDNTFFDLLYIDKWVHTFFYFVLAFLLFNSWIGGNSFLLKATIILIICTLFGLAIEIMQDEYTTTRHFEWLDLVFDSVGAIIYIFIWLRKRARDFLK